MKDDNGTYLALTVGTKSEPVRHVDLSSLPDSCKIVNPTGPHPDLESFRFWEACNKGCVVSLAGTRAMLSRSTQRKVCLGRISVFLSEDIPFPLYGEFITSFGNVLQNVQGNYTLADPNFLDEIDIRPNGRAYTGMGFFWVQAGYLCGNLKAKMVIASVVAAFALLLLLSTIVIVVVGRSCRRVCRSGQKAEKLSRR